MKFNRQKLLKGMEPIIEYKRGAGISIIQETNLNRLFNYIENDQRWNQMAIKVAVRILAYFLATVALEAKTKKTIGGKKVFVSEFNPIREMGGKNYFNRLYDTGKKALQLGNTPAADGDGAKFAGAGYVQDTGRGNALKLGMLLSGMVITKDDLPSDPQVRSAFFRAAESYEGKLVVSKNTFANEPDLRLIPKVSYESAVDGILTGRFTGKKIGTYINGSKCDYFNARRTINGVVPKVATEIADNASRIEEVLLKTLDSGGDLPANQPAKITPSEPQTVDKPAVSGGEKPATKPAVEPAPEPSKPDFISNAIDANVTADETKVVARSVASKIGKRFFAPLTLLYVALEAGNIYAWFGVIIAAAAIVVFIVLKWNWIKSIFKKLADKFTTPPPAV